MERPSRWPWVVVESLEAVLGAKKSKILKVFVSVRGWPGNIFDVFWWSFGMICIVLILFSMYFSVNFLKKLSYGVTSRRRFGGRRCDSGTEKIKILNIFCFGSGMAWKYI